MLFAQAKLAETFQRAVEAEVSFKAMRVSLPVVVVMLLMIGYVLTSRKERRAFRFDPTGITVDSGDSHMD